MFTLDTESGFRDVVFITASYGLGEMVVQGAVNPDEFYVHKPTLAAGRPAILRRNLGSKAHPHGLRGARQRTARCAPTTCRKPSARRFSLSDAEVEELATQALLIEKHYGRPMDIEWAQGRRRTASSTSCRRARRRCRAARGQVIERYHLQADRARSWPTAAAIGHRIGAGAAKVIASIGEMDRVQPGDVLVTDMTDPDWEPVMKRAAAIVTNRGGRTCHAAIIARELGMPAVVGCGDATDRISGRRHQVTVSCAEGDTGFIYDGKLAFEHKTVELDDMPELAGQDHDERRQPGARLRLRQPCPTPASGWRGWSSSSTT